MTNHANGAPSKAQRDRASELLTHHRDFAMERERLCLIKAAFGGVEGAQPILDRRPDLDRGPQAAAVGLVAFLADFGCLGGRHTLSILLDEVRTRVGDDQQGQIVALIRDLDALCDQPPDALCPYRDLRAFREEDAPLYFGRHTFTERLVEAVGRWGLVAVIGASGSGKSSVVQAGLIPRLRAQGGWEVGSLRPGGNPWRSLAACLSGLLGDEPAAEIDRLRSIGKLADDLANPAASGPALRLPDLIGRLLEKRPSVRRLLLVVDQWEELYTHGSNAARGLADCLIAASEATPLKVVLTLRADFLGHALAHRPLVDRLQEGKVLLGPMTRDELEQAMLGPASAVGLDFEPGLVERILDDVGTEPGHLPLLEFCLTRLCARRQGGRMLHAAYEAIGRVPGAIVQRADEVIDALPAPDQERARDLFLHLVQLGEGTEDTRRRAALGDLGEAARPLVTRLADARLLVTGRDAGSGEETIEVAHEALIRNWPRLRCWLDQDRDDLRLRREVERIAGAWDAHGRAPAYRWSDARVMEAAPAVRRVAPRLPFGDRERAFLGPFDQADMLALIQDPATPHADRALIGDRLNLLPGGDPRPGVGLRGDGLPDIAWCAIPGGEVEIAVEAAGAWARLRRLARTRPRFRVAPHYLAKYPVTVAQWRVFLDAVDGYDDLVRRPHKVDPARQPGGDNHPAVSVLWIEAMAYCKWLGRKFGREVRLATEWEWQHAATSGHPDFQYPWGKAWFALATNTNESGLGRLMAVGLYPEGSSVHGVADLAGNIGEWCLNKPEHLKDISLDGKGIRAVRGASWGGDQRFARATFRNGYHPDDRVASCGFRVLMEIPSSLYADHLSTDPLVTGH